MSDRVQEIRDRLAGYLFARGHPTAGAPTTGEFVTVAMDDLAYLLHEFDQLTIDRDVESRVAESRLAEIEQLKAELVIKNAFYAAGR